MRVKSFIILTVFLLGLPETSRSWWFEYTTIGENMPVAAEPDIFEGYPVALPYSDGRTLVVYKHENLQLCYQIIDRYGQLQYPDEPQQLVPDLLSGFMYGAQVIPDGSGGVFAAWYITESGAYPGVYAQRLDSLGNRMWGDAGKLIFPWCCNASFNISKDGANGLLVAAPYNGDIYVQRAYSSGDTAWGAEGVIVCGYLSLQDFPNITHDGAGGAYVVWTDHRYPDEATYMQRLDADGNAQWTPGGVFIADPDWLHDVIPDGEGGMILHNGGGYNNRAYRIAPDGSTLWVRDYVSSWVTAKIVEGDAGYFYLGYVFEYNQRISVYGQKMDMDGNLYWRTPGQAHSGAFMMSMGDWPTTGKEFIYQYPYFYGISVFDHNGLRSLNVQLLDSLGNRQFESRGVIIAEGTTIVIQWPNIVPDGDGGVVGIFQSPTYGYNIWGKHVNPDGTLGGIDPRRRHEESTPQISGTSTGLIHYQISEPGTVTLDLYNLLGRHVRMLESAYRLPGSYALRIDPSNLASGVYFIKLSTATGCQTEKIVIAR